MEPSLLSIGIVFVVLVVWTAISFYIPTRTMRALIKGIEDCRQGNVRRFDYDDFLKELKEEKRWQKKHPIRAKLLQYWYRLRSFWFNVPDMPRDFINEIKYAYQRLTRGWSNRDAWSVGGYISHLALAMLKHHKKVAHGYHETLPLPEGVKLGDGSKAEDQWHKDCLKEWNTILDKMIYAFKLNSDIANGDREHYYPPAMIQKISKKLREQAKYLTEEEEVARKEGMALFCKYLHYLWD